MVDNSVMEKCGETKRKENKAMAVTKLLNFREQNVIKILIKKMMPAIFCCCFSILPLCDAL